MQSEAGPSKEKKGSSQQLMSSEELLSRIHARNFLLPDYDYDGPGTSSVRGEDNMELLADIRNFVAFCGMVDGQATTQELVDRFKDRLPPGNSPLFKAMLQQICDFQRAPDGVGLWRLKAEFR